MSTDGRIEDTVDEEECMPWVDWGRRGDKQECLRGSDLSCLFFAICIR